MATYIEGAAVKIAISAEGADLEAEVGRKFGASQYLVIVDLETMAFEAIPNPGATAQRGVGVQAVVLVISKDARAVLTGYCGPAIRRQLLDAGIEVITGLSGTVGELVGKYKKGDLQGDESAEAKDVGRSGRFDRVAIVQALRSSAKQFYTLLPVLIGVVLLIGLFEAFVSKDVLSSIFSGSPALDTLWGACFGSIFAGNPINSYVIGGELMENGVSMFAVTALILTWVTVGLVQLPAEIAALGKRFAIVRTVLCFVLSIPVAMLTVTILNLVTR